MNYPKMSSYSTRHLKNIIKDGKMLLKGGIRNYDTTKYELELENRKGRSLDKGWENGFHYNRDIGRWVKLNKDRKERLKERFVGKDLKFYLLK